jgi:hypothetical protein
MKREIETDYLVVGAGAMGVAFADEIIHGSKHARVVLVDRRAKPGGHWNDAYPFVTLHQPALFYGVNSLKLGSGGKDLVSRSQILGYYERVLKKLAATGRFTFLPLCHYEGDRETGRARIVSTIAPDLEYDVTVRKKTADATYMDVRVPANTKPKYEVSEDVRVVPINALADVDRPYARYVVIGAGKTGIDAALYLLERDVDPDRITWIMPNDSWFLNRENIQPREVARDFPAQLRAITESDSLSAVYERLEAEGRLLRLDPDVWPAKYRCATVTLDELEELRRIRDVVRQGRVLRVDESGIELTQGARTFSRESEAGAAERFEILYIDCTADGLATRPARPIYAREKITLQSIMMCQQVMSAAVIAAIELRFDDDEKKNEVCQPVPHPEFVTDYPYSLYVSFNNLEKLGTILTRWMLGKRLSLGSHMGFIEKFRFGVAVKRWMLRDPERLERLIEAG